MSIKDELTQKIYAHVEPAIDDIIGATERRHAQRMHRVRVAFEHGDLPQGLHQLPTSFTRQITDYKARKSKPYTCADLPRFENCAVAFAKLDPDAVSLLQAEDKRRWRNMRRRLANVKR